MYIKSSEKKENLRISSLCIEFDFNSGKTDSLSIAFKIAPDLNFGLLKKGAYTASVSYTHLTLPTTTIV